MNTKHGGTTTISWTSDGDDIDIISSKYGSFKLVEELTEVSNRAFDAKCQALLFDLSLRTGLANKVLEKLLVSLDERWVGHGIRRAVWTAEGDDIMITSDGTAAEWSLNRRHDGILFKSIPVEEMSQSTQDALREITFKSGHANTRIAFWLGKQPNTFGFSAAWNKNHNDVLLFPAKADAEPIKLGGWIPKDQEIREFTLALSRAMGLSNKKRTGKGRSSMGGAETLIRKETRKNANERQLHTEAAKGTSTFKANRDGNPTSEVSTGVEAAAEKADKLAGEQQAKEAKEAEAFKEAEKARVAAEKADKLAEEQQPTKAAVSLPQEEEAAKVTAAAAKNMQDKDNDPTSEVVTGVDQEKKTAAEEAATVTAAAAKKTQDEDEDNDNDNDHFVSSTGDSDDHDDTEPSSDGRVNKNNCAICRVCAQSPTKHRWKETAALSHPKKFWTDAANKDALSQSRLHAENCHPHWPLWNSTRTKIKAIPAGVEVAEFVFYRALDHAAHKLPHDVDQKLPHDVDDTKDAFLMELDKRVGLAIGYACGGKTLWTGKWWSTFVKTIDKGSTDKIRESIAIAATALVLSYGGTLHAAVTAEWKRIGALTHQQKVDLYHNVFLVPYCIDAVRLSSNLFPPVNIPE
jgi:hypothetical protein